jgi:hypothetical protein
MLYLKKSLIPGAGKGLFVKKEFKRGDIVCEYEGEIVPWSVCEKRAEEGHEGYAFFITKNRQHFKIKHICKKSCNLMFMITLGKYHPPAIMEPFTPFCWECMVMIILIITIVVRVPFHFKKVNPKTYATFIALFFSINFIVENYYNYQQGLSLIHISEPTRQP